LSKIKPRRQSRAIALQYNDVQRLPSVAAAGIGQVARRIIELAKEHDIPIHEDSALADMLAALEVKQAITPETFRLVAEVLCFLYATDRDWRENHQLLHPIIGDALDGSPAMCPDDEDESTP
jgi:flagellar biosynthesis protein